MKRILTLFLAAVMLCAAAGIAGCEKKPETGKYDLSMADGVCFRYDDLEVYLTDEDVGIIEEALAVSSLALTSEYDEIDVTFSEETTAETKAKFAGKDHIELVFSSPVAIALTRKSGRDFVLNDYTGIVIPAEGNVFYVHKNGVYSAGAIGPIDTSGIKELMAKYKEKLRAV